jgi:AraC-like DNA-binding protein
MSQPLPDLPFATVAFTSPPRLFYWDRDFRWSPPPLTDFDLWCILEGRGSVQLRGATHDLVPGLCFVLRPGDRPEACHDPEHPLVAFFAHFDMRDGRGRTLRKRRLVLPPPALAVRDLALFSALAKRCVNTHQRGDALGRRQSRLALEQMLALVWEWWLLPPPMPSDTAVQEVIRQVQRRPGQVWEVSEMARRAHLSRAQFTRRFRALTGRAPMAYVIRARLDLARQLVLETTMSLTAIAAELGYEDLYFFSRQFKQRYGHPPSALRPTRTGKSPSADPARR